MKIRSIVTIVSLSSLRTLQNPLCYNFPMTKITHFFDKLEDKIRGGLSHYPILYSIVGGFTLVLFWRSVWHTADILKEKGGILGFIFYEPHQIIITLAILLATGLMVSIFIGDQIIISGIKHEKKLTEKTEVEVTEESITLVHVLKRLDGIQKEITELRSEIKK